MFSTYFLRFAGVFFVTFYLAMESATATLETPVTIKIPSSGGSSTAGSKFTCSAKNSNLRSVRFQSVEINGSTYQRKQIDYASLTSGGPVVQKTFTAANLGTCLVAAGKAGVDAIGYNNSVCSGYIMGTNLTVCPCLSEGDTLVFVNKKKFSNTRSVIYSKVGSYTKTVVYSDALAEIAALQQSFDSIDNCIVDLREDPNGGQCFDTSGHVFTNNRLVYDTTFCTSCNGAPVTVVTRPQTYNKTSFLDMCGATVKMDTGALNLLSHAAYGCTYYPQPSTATDCEVTFVKTSGTVILSSNVYLARTGTTCNDELVVYNGTSTSGVVAARKCNGVLSKTLLGPNVKMTVVFKREPHVTGTSSPLGFDMIVM